MKSPVFPRSRALVAVVTLAALVFTLASFPQPSHATGFTWTARSEAPAGAWKDIALSADGSAIVAVQDDGDLYRSIDGGDTWGAPETVNVTTHAWVSVDMSSGGEVIVAAVRGGNLYVSADGGDSWNAADLGETDTANFISVTATASGAKLAAASDAGIYTSSDSGATWTLQAETTGRAWDAVTYSRDGTRIFGIEDQGQFYRSTDGASWTILTNVSPVTWSDIVASGNGTHVFAASDGNVTFLSNDAGDNWSFGTRNYHDVRSISLSSDGSVIVMASHGDSLQVSSDGGSNWADEAGVSTWAAADVSPDGAYAVAADEDGHIYTTWGAEEGATAPTIEPSTAESVTATTSLVSVDVSASGSSHVSTYGAVYADATTYLSTGYAATSTSISGDFGTSLSAGKAITGLTCGTTYHYRIFATNSEGATGYGSDTTFTTTTCDPPVTFDGGDGSALDPYEINTCIQLQGMAQHLSAYYVLMGPISCSGTNPMSESFDTAGRWADENGFDPVGTSTAPFTGTLDGGGFTVSDLFIDGGDWSGLFGHATGHIHDLILADVAITGGDHVGALAGAADGSVSIEQVSITSGSVEGDVWVGGLIGTVEGTVATSSAAVTVIGNNDVGGLIGRLDGGTVTASFASSTVAATANSNSVGGFVGIVDGASITDSYSLGPVDGTDTGFYTGGFAGEVVGSIVGSYAAGSVTGGTSVGGFAGKLWNGTIRNSHARGTVAGAVNSIGGFAGANGADGSIATSYATGQVEGLATSDGAFSVGGFAGDNDGAIDRSFSVGLVNAPDYVQRGGFVGYSGAGSTLTNSGWWTGSFEFADGFHTDFELAYSLSDRDGFKDAEESFYASGWDFVGTPSAWSLDETAYPRLNGGWPYLTALSGSYHDEGLETVDAYVPPAPDGSEERPYQIDTCEELQAMHDDLDAHYVLVDDVDCSATTAWNSGHGFRPIGGGAEGAPPFTGTFEGDGYTISGLFMDWPDLFTTGLFGTLTGAEIGGVFLEDLTVRGAYFAGGLAGALIESQVFDSAVSGESEVTKSAVDTELDFLPPGAGGLVGYAGGSLIYGGRSSARVSGLGPLSVAGGLVGFFQEGAVYAGRSTGAVLIGAGGIAGGLIGGNLNGETIASSATGSVTGPGGIMGGFAGFNLGTIEMAYARGNVSALGPIEGEVAGIGGFTGVNMSDLTQAYSTGVVSSQEDPNGLVAGFVGNNSGDITVSFWNTDRAGAWEGCGVLSSDCDGVTGASTATLKTEATFASDLGEDAWDFEAWGLDPDENNGYPSFAFWWGTEHDDVSEDAVEEEPDVEAPRHAAHHRNAKQAALRTIERYMKAGDTGDLANYVSENADRLRRYAENGTELSPQVKMLLENSFPVPAAAPTTSLMPVRDLELGVTGDDVRALQTLLIARASGPASAALGGTGATGFFGPLTRAALAEYQKASGITPAAGYFGSLTRAQAKAAGMTVWW